MGAFLTAWCLLGWFFVATAHRSSGSPTAFLTGAAFLGIAVSVILSSRMLWSDTVSSVSAVRAQAGLWSSAVGCAASAAISALTTAPIVFAGAGLLVGLLTWRPYVELTRKAAAMKTQKPLGARSPEEADQAVEACHRQLQETGISPSRRLEVEFNLVSALLERSGSRRHRDGMADAADLLDQILARPSVSPPNRYRAVSELVNIKNQLASRDGTDTGYEAAVDQQSALAEQLSNQEDRAYARTQAALERANLLTYRLSRLTPQEDEDEGRRLFEALLDSFERAIETEPVGASFTPPIRSRLGAALLLVDAEEAMAELRAGWESVRERPMFYRASAQLYLAQGLIQQAERGSGPAEPLLSEAESLCTEVIAAKTPMDRFAHENMAQILTLRSRRRQTSDDGPGGRVS